MKLVQTIDNAGKPIINFARYILELTQMVYLAFRSISQESIRARRMVRQVLGAQIFFTGWGAMPVASVLAVATGSVIVLNTSDQSTLLGSGGVTGSFLYLVVVRELGPLVVALLVIARSGTAVSSELGTMSANRELDALRAMGISPLGFLVFPRILGGVLSVFCVSFYFDLIAIFSGFLMTWFLREITPAAFVDSILQNISPGDLFVIFLKNLCNGLIIFSVSSYQGMRVRQSLHEVPQVTTKAVVISIASVTAVNFIIVALWYLHQYEMSRL